MLRILLVDDTPARAFNLRPVLQEAGYAIADVIEAEALNLAGPNGVPDVIVVDTHAKPRKARLLADRTGAIARLTPAIARRDLDSAALESDPEYLPELARIMAAAMATQPSSP